METRIMPFLRFGLWFQDDSSVAQAILQLMVVFSNALLSRKRRQPNGFLILKVIQLYKSTSQK